MKLQNKNFDSNIKINNKEQILIIIKISNKLTNQNCNFIKF